MSTKILMPALSPTMTVGNLSKWLVKEGDKINAGQVIAEIETDKATMEVEAVDEGKITSILVNEGEENIAVNTPLAILNGSGDDKIDEIIDDNTPIIKEEIKDNIKIESKKIKKIISKTDNKVFASPYAKKIAHKENIDLNTIDGSGPNGRIIMRDLMNLSQENTKIMSFPKHEVLEASNIRKIIAEKTTETKNTVPHFYLTIESKVDKLIKLRKIINEENTKYKISINDFLIKAIAVAQKNNPLTNVSWHNNKIIKYNSIDVSVAVALEEGLLTPIIKDADKKGILNISEEMKQLVKKAKEGKLLPDEYNGGTITISNLGMYGINEFSAIINPPQSSILAVGSINDVIILDKNNEVKSIKTIKFTLSADHRVLDGAIAAKLLKDFNDIIENPFDLWLQSDDMKII